MAYHFAPPGTPEPIYVFAVLPFFYDPGSNSFEPAPNMTATPPYGWILCLRRCNLVISLEGGQLVTDTQVLDPEGTVFWPEQW